MPMPPFQGSITALITPFKNGAVDEKTFQRLVDWQIDEGTHGLVPVGTTGESPTLTHEEHTQVIELCIEAAAGRVPVIAGAGSNSTEEAIALTRFAKEAGADAALVVTPYYNKPTQEGLVPALQGRSPTRSISPIIIYNIPARCVIDISVDTMARLPSCRTSSASRTRPPSWRGRRSSAPPSGPDFSSCPARTRPRSASSRMAAMAASR